MIKHLAYSIPYKVLVNELKLAEANGFVYSRIHPHHPELQLWCYTPKCVIEKQWNVATKSARGLVLNTKDELIQSVGFSKFFNLGEMSALPTGQLIAYEKLDGSLIHTFYYKGLWYFHTKGCWDHENSYLARSLWNEGHPCNLDRNATYLFELLHPRARIVINYGDQPKLCLLTAYRNGEELIDNPPFSGDSEIFTRPEIYSASTIAELDLMKPNFEGYVVRYDCGTRVKIKTEEYVRLHRLIGDVNRKRILELLISGMSLPAIKASMPEQFSEDIEEIGSSILAECQPILDEVWFFYGDNKKLSRKDYAIKGQTCLAAQKFAAAMTAYLTVDAEQVKKAILKSLK